MSDLFTSIYSKGFNQMNMNDLFNSKKDNNKSVSIFSNINNNVDKTTNLFSDININANNNQEDDEHCCVVINDELSNIAESANESVSGTESALKSRKNSHLNLKNLKDILNSNDEKKKEEFLKPFDININNINNKNEPNNIFNIINNNSNENNIQNSEMDFEDEVNRQYGLFPIV